MNRCRSTANVQDRTKTFQRFTRAAADTFFLNTPGENSVLDAFEAMDDVLSEHLCGFGEFITFDERNFRIGQME